MEASMEASMEALQACLLSRWEEAHILQEVDLPAIMLLGIILLEALTQSAPVLLLHDVQAAATAVWHLAFALSLAKLFPALGQPLQASMNPRGDDEWQILILLTATKMK
jgi:hypothetical protein